MPASNKIPNIRPKTVNSVVDSRYFISSYSHYESLFNLNPKGQLFKQVF